MRQINETDEIGSGLGRMLVTAHQLSHFIYILRMLEIAYNSKVI